jgi:hypothetical protein
MYIIFAEPRTKLAFAGDFVRFGGEYLTPATFYGLFPCARHFSTLSHKGVDPEV